MAIKYNWLFSETQKITSDGFFKLKYRGIHTMDNISAEVDEDRKAQNIFDKFQNCLFHSENWFLIYIITMPI